MFLNAPWKLFYVNLPFERLFVTFWKLLRSHAVTPRWLDDAKDCTQSGWSEQQDCCSFSLLFSRNPVCGCWSLLENYLAVSTWIFNGSSIECQEKKHQPFSLSGVRYGSQAIQISTGKFAWHWSGRKWAIHPWLLVLITCSNSQRKAHIIVQIRHFEPQKFCNE